MKTHFSLLTSSSPLCTVWSWERDTVLSCLQTGGRWCHFPCSPWEINAQESAEDEVQKGSAQKWGRAWGSAQPCGTLRQQASSHKDFSGCTSLHKQGSTIPPLHFPTRRIASDRVHVTIYQDQGRISTEKVKPELLSKLQELTKRKILVAGVSLTLN